MGSWLSEIAAAIRAAGMPSQVAAVYIWGPLLTAWGFIAGWREGIPTPYLLASSAVIFGAVNWSLHQFSLWRERSSIQSKLRFIRVVKNLDGQFRGQDLHLDQIQYAVELHNTAHFPINFRINNMKGEFAGRTHAGRGPKNEGAIMMGCHATLAGTSIGLNPAIIFRPGDSREGKFALDICYGKGKGLQHRIRHTFRTRVTLDLHNPRNLTFAWDYAEDLGDEPPSD
jgi:hypothetical protein